MLRRNSTGEHIQRYSDLNRRLDQVQDLCRVINVLLRLGNKYIHMYTHVSRRVDQVQDLYRVINVLLRLRNKYIHMYIHVQKPTSIFERLVSQ